MTIVFGCPNCRHGMRAPDEKAGVPIKCPKCGLAQAIPPARPAPTSGSKPGLAAVGLNRADEFLADAQDHKQKNDLEGALKLLHRAYAEIRLTHRMYPIDTFLLLPIYLDLAGYPKEAWQEFNHLLFQGPPNRPMDAVSVAQDRHKVLERMRHFLEKDGQPEVAAVYEAASMVCKGFALYHEDRKRELHAWFSPKNCTTYLQGLKRYHGNLGRLEPVHAILVDEIGQHPVNLPRLLQRVDEALAKG